MQILLYVIAFLMVFAGFDYVQLQRYKERTILQRMIISNLKESYCHKINNLSKKRYDEIKVAERSPSRNISQSDAIKKVSVALFFHPENREDNSKYFWSIQLLTKRLLKNLYSERAWYQDYEQETGELIDSFLAELVHAAEDYPRNIQSVNDLIEFELGDAKLNKILYYMLDDKDNPLGEYITLKNSKFIRIYLAPKKLLMAIYGNEMIIEDIIKQRYEYYKQVTRTKDPLEKDQATFYFKQQFEGMQLSDIDDSMLNFDVSKASPGKPKN